MLSITDDVVLTTSLCCPTGCITGMGRAKMKGITGQFGGAGSGHGGRRAAPSGDGLKRRKGTSKGSFSEKHHGEVGSPTAISNAVRRCVAGILHYLAGYTVLGGGRSRSRMV